MFRELKGVYRVPGEPRRRIFEDDDYFELTVWFGEEDEPLGFQLCYDVKKKPRVVTWFPESGLRHVHVDTGDDSVFANRAPLLQGSAGRIPRETEERFSRESGALPEDLAEFIRAGMADGDR